jgi:hypothetical protein
MARSKILNPSGRIPITERAAKHAEAFGPLAEKEIQAKGYLARELVQCGMPLTRPAENSIVRKNGNVSVIYTSGVDREGKPIGLPYGPMARLLLLWINSQAFTQRSHRIKVTSHLYEFLRELGVPITTGKRGGTKTIRSQINRLLRSQIAFVREDGTRDSYALMPIGPKYNLWWSYENPSRTAFSRAGSSLGKTSTSRSSPAPSPSSSNTLKPSGDRPLPSTSTSG